MPTISVVIPTKDRADSLVRAAQSISAQTVLPLELVVVDQTPEPADLHARLRQTCGNRIGLQYIWDPKISGGAPARNVALEVVKGSIILFLDDDVTLHPDFIENLLLAYHKHPDASGISGIPDNYTPPERFYSYWSRIFMRGPFHDDRQPVYWRAMALGEAVPVSRMSGGMMSLLKASIGSTRFDPDLRGVSDGEDVDFCMHLSGAKLYLEPRCLLTHHFDPKGRAGDHWLRRHVQSHAYLYRRNWRSAKAAYLWLWAGWIFAAILSSASRRSFTPFREIARGYRASLPEK